MAARRKVKPRPTRSASQKPAKAQKASKRGKARSGSAARGKLARGPRKKRARGPSPRRTSTHKKRAAWFQARSSWPFREADTAHLILERAKRAALAEAVGDTRRWQCVGPTNIGGRSTALVVHPQDADVLWLGTAGGGVWKSEDGGKSWSTAWHDQESLNVGSLGLDPEDPNVIYCGTGEANLSADSYAGVGVYRSEDGGATWTLWADARVHQLPRRIGVVAIDPHDRAHIRLGGVAHADGDASGMFVTRDGGVTWQRESFATSFGYHCHSIVFHPRTPGVLFATLNARGAKSGVWRSTDGGVSFSQLRAGLPSPDRFRRATLTISPSDPDTLYLIVGAEEDGVLGVFVSSDGGAVWSSIGGAHFDAETQMSYGSAIAVHPTDPRQVICGGVDLHRTTNGGVTWRQITRWDASRGDTNYAHADHHALVMPASRPGLVYAANDGGLDRSEDGGRTWQNCSNGLANVMYYDLDVAPSDARSFGGGTQDNGTNVTDTGSIDDHFEILGGDGGWMVYRPESAGRLFASYYNFHIYRFRGSQEPRDVSPLADREEASSVWMCFITIDPNVPNTVFAGSYRLWRSTNDGTTWQPVSPSFDGSSISAIEVAPADSNLVLIGTENGALHRSLDGGNTWSSNLAGPQMSGRTVTRIDAHPTDADVVYATTAGIHRSHVYRSGDKGETWSDVDRGQLPDLPHHAVLIHPVDGRRVYVCNDAGVYVTEDDGVSWANLSGNLPNVMVVDLVYHVGDAALYAATYGRSIWRLRLD